MKDDEEMFRFRLKDSNRVHRRKTKEIKKHIGANPTDDQTHDGAPGNRELVRL